MRVCLFSFCLLFVAVEDAGAGDLLGQPSIQFTDQTKIDALSNEQVTVYGKDRTLWLVPSVAGLAEKKVTIPRLSAPLKAMGWKESGQRELKFTPEREFWVFSWKEDGAEDVIEIELEREPMLFNAKTVVVPAADGTLMLQAYQGKTVGEKLRYEPQWYKNTIGYWTNPKDFVEWNVQIDEPGVYAVAVLQGLGDGQGGNEAVLSLRQGDDVVGEVEFEPVVTGHFQNFRWVHLGMIEVTKSGEYRVRIEAKKIAKAALMDVRAVHLGKQAKGK